MRILQLEHWPARFAYDNAPYFARRGAVVEDLRIYAGEPGPDPAGYDALIVYGGYMSAYDDAGNPWIADELRYMERLMEAGVPLLGICLGAQLLARLLGARVYRSPSPEFGFQRLRLTKDGAAYPATAALLQSAKPVGATPPSAGSLGADEASPSDFLALEWHNDAWDLPAGAVRLAEGEYWQNQAFAYGDRTLAIQFHLEFTREHMAWAVDAERGSIARGPGCEDPDAFLARPERFGELTANMERLLDGFLG